MMFNHNGQKRLERRIQRRFQQNAMNDTGLANFNIYEYVNGEVIMTESGNEYILWDNKWLDLPEVIDLDHLLDMDGGFGYRGSTAGISREAYIKQEYNVMILQSASSPIGLDFPKTLWDLAKSIITGSIPNRISAENALIERIKLHDDR